MRRVYPIEYKDSELAKELLLYGEDIWLCIRCSGLVERDGVSFCSINNLSLEDVKVEKSSCVYFIRKE